MSHDNNCPGLMPEFYLLWPDPWSLVDIASYSEPMTWDQEFTIDDQLGVHILPLAISLDVSCDLKG